MHELLTDRSALQERLQQLTGGLNAKRVDPEIIGAIAECCFRLAVHPDTPVEDALRLLHSAVRHDNKNPKYAYHLGRIYFIHGQLDLAATWLALAQRLCPTSHRVWAHISLLDVHLNARYVGDKQFEPDGLLRRADDLIQEIMKGSDEIPPELLDTEPPRNQAVDSRPTIGQAPPPQRPIPARKRLIRPNQCRWSGVSDLQLEWMLEKAPSARTMKKALTRLQQVATSASVRPGGTAAFVISAAQWMVIGGYPVSTVRRLRADLVPSGHDESTLALLDLLCDLCETDPGELPGRLATEIEDGRLPPMVGALIHRWLVGWVPAEFRATLAYRQARALVDRGTPRRATNDADPQQADDRKADAHIEALSRALAAFVPAKRAQFDDPLPVASPEESGRAVGQGPSAAATFAALEERSTVLTEIRDQAWRHLKETVLPLTQDLSDPARRALATADCAAVAALTDALKHAGTQGVADVDSSVKAVAAEGSGIADLPDRAAACKNRFSSITGLGTFAKQIASITARLRQADAQHGTAPSVPPSPSLSNLLALAGAAGGPAPAASETKAASARRPAAEPGLPSPKQVGVAGLRLFLSEVDAAVDAAYSHVLASFEAYPPKVAATVEYRRLITTAHARQAETDFRLGRYASARRSWNAIATTDRLDLSALKNIALCDARFNDVARSRQSWRSYAEMLYFYDVVSRTARPLADARADLHRILANNSGPRFLLGDLGKDAIDSIAAQQLIAFLDSPIRVVDFTDNALLQRVNERLALSSPSLILGTTKADSNRAREKGAGDLVALVRALQPSLPTRIGAAFYDLTESHVNQAVATCSTASRLAARADRVYEEEREAVLSSIKSLCETKVWLIMVLAKEFDLVRRTVRPFRLIESLERLCRLDQFPLSHSRDLVITVAGQLGLRDADSTQRVLTDQVFGHVLTWIFSTPDDQTDRLWQEDAYRALVAQINQPTLAPLGEVLDDPQPFYPASVVQAVQSGGHDSADRAVQDLRRWHQRFPHSTGPSRLLASFLLQQEAYDEAARVLGEARERGFLTARTVGCVFERMMVWYSKAASCSRRKDVSGMVSAARLALPDAEFVLRECQDETEVAHAQRIQSDCRDLLDKAGDRY